YWEYGHIDNLMEVDVGLWEAEVAGTDDYLVQMRMKDEHVAEYSCTCPYDWGPICKHVVAVLFALREMVERYSKHQEAKTPRGRRRPPRKTPMEQLEEILAKISPDQLNDFIKNFAVENRDFRNAFITEHLGYISGETKAAFKQIIRSSFREAMDRDGFIGYRDTSKSVRNIHTLLQKAGDDFEQSHFEKVIPICQAVIEEAVPALQYADDSDGNIGAVIERAFEFLQRIPVGKLGAKQGEDLFDYCLQEALDIKYRGWHWSWDFLRIAVPYVRTNEQEKRLFKQIDTMSEFEENRYDSETASQIKLDFFRRRKTKKETREFIQSNLQFPSFRELALKEALRNKQYSTVRQLAEEGVKMDSENNLRGLVNTWKEWLLKVSEKEEKTDDIRKYARQLFFSTHDMHYYQELKGTFQNENWPDELDSLIQELKKEKVAHVHTLANIYIEEKRWDDLYRLVKSNTDFQMLTHYERYLKDTYLDELIDMYETAVRKFLVDFTGRPAYQQCCRILRRMKKLGAEQRVEKLTHDLRNHYKNRPALLDELTRV
ncbi:MAG: SWIM zinc finger domain-containing protein, partial [Candidatus Heimdallarchaeota archaeon]